MSNEEMNETRDDKLYAMNKQIQPGGDLKTL